MATQKEKLIVPFCFRCGNEYRKAEGFLYQLELKTKEDTVCIWLFCPRCLRDTPWERVFRDTAAGYEQRRAEEEKD